MFELSNLFVFHRTLDTDIQSMLEFLQLNDDFLASGDNVTCLSIYFLLFRLEMWLSDRVVSALCLSSSAEDSRALRFPYSSGNCGL